MTSYSVSPNINNEDLNTLFNASWDTHTEIDFQKQLSHCLFHICAFDEKKLIGFVKVAWDGGIHAFLLDTTVDPDFRRKGIGKELVLRAVEESRTKGMHWIEADYEEHLEGFYLGCGFRKTKAGLINLQTPEVK